MAAEALAREHRSTVDVAADPPQLFALLDDHRRLAAHMEKPSLMAAGASMRIETDARHGQAVGSVIRMSGRALGLDLAVDEAVIEREPPFRKAWQTLGEPRLLVIGAYRMGFAIAPQQGGSRLVVWIEYQLPSRGVAHVLGWLFGRAYAAWCTRRMASDAVAAFARGANR